MDPLSVAASIAGLLTATHEVGKILGPYVSAARETPPITSRVHAEVQSASVILSALQTLTNNLASVPAQRAALIQVDQIVTILTDGVLLFSELEAALRFIPSQDPLGPRLPLRSRLQWARKENAFVALLTRLQSFKSSISLILIIINR
jgi:cell division control protein 24